MKFSYEWLRELVPGLTGTPEEVTALITMKTAECEGVEPFAPWLARVCAARVLAVTPVEGSHNVCARVDAGPELGEKQVVCGAPNCRAGLVTAYVPAGVALAGKEIRKAVIAGVESDGMLASGAELGRNRDADGSLELPADHRARRRHRRARRRHRSRQQEPDPSPRSLGPSRHGPGGVGVLRA